MVIKERAGLIIATSFGMANQYADTFNVDQA